MNSALPAALPVVTIMAGILISSMAFGSAALADQAGDTTDPVTGYECVSQGCLTVRPPDADCICVKRNPGEQDAGKVVLACSTKRGGHWVACPVKPRYGVSPR
jgi:hypothetical protein